MIIEGNKVNPCKWSGQSKNLAAHLRRTDTNEKAEVLEMRGFASNTLEGAFEEINLSALGTRATKAAYHAKINPQMGETLTEEQAAAAADKLEKALGFDGQARVIVEHVKNGRQHFHVVWDRIDLEHGKAIDTPVNYRTHERVAVELEQEFHLSPTPTRAHLREPGQARPEQNAEKWQYEQTERLGAKTPREQAAEITALYARADNGAALQAALAENGYTLAKGDKDGVFLVVDELGGFASLSRRVDGAKAADIRAKLADLDRTGLPTLDEVRAGLCQEREAEKRHDQLLKGEAQAAKEAGIPHAKIDMSLAYIRQARAASSDVQGLVGDLEAHGFTVAKIESDKDLSHVASRGQAFGPGDLVALSARGRTYRVTETERDLPWQAAKNGLTAEQEAKAQAAFGRWQKTHQGGKAMDFAAYVAFVQAKHETPHLLDFKAFDASALPTLDGAKEARRQAQLDQQTGLTKTAQALRGLVSEACAQGATGEVFTGYLAAKGVFVAQDNGRIVAIDKWEHSTAFGEYNTGLTAAKIAARLEGARLPNAYEAMERAGNYREAERDVFAGQQARDALYDRTATSLDKAAHEIERIGGNDLRVAGCTLKSAGKVLDKVADVAEAILSFFDPPKPRVITPAELWASKEAQRERVAQLKEQSRETEALGRIADQIQKDKLISYADLLHLGRDSLEQLKARGDDGLRDMIHQREQENERSGFGRSRSMER